MARCNPAGNVSKNPRTGTRGNSLVAVHKGKHNSLDIIQQRQKILTISFTVPGIELKIEKIDDNE